MGSKTATPAKLFPEKSSYRAQRDRMEAQMLGRAVDVEDDGDQMDLEAMGIEAEPVQTIDGSPDSPENMMALGMALLASRMAVATDREDEKSEVVFWQHGQGADISAWLRGDS